MYAELHCHSAYSFLDGASHPDELMTAAAELGYEALALTDHNGVFGSMEHAQAAKAAGLRALHGAEVDLDDGRHLTLLVEDAEGWRNLCRILTRAHTHTREASGGRVVVPASVPLDVVLDHARGLVCLSGCARQGVRDEPTMRRLLDAFGPGGLRLELQRPFLRHDRALNRGLASLARRLGVPTVATGDVHAHSRARALLQDAFVAIREHAALDASEPLRRGNHSHVLASPAAMAARFDDHPDAVRETLRLADRLRFDLTHDLGYRYPGCDDAEADRRLAELCWARFEDRYPAAHSRHGEALARLEEELRVIEALGLAGFFILHRDLLELAREVAAEVRGPDTARALLPPGRGRGSSVSSIVCYLTGLSHIDPVANDLFLGRFLNDELTALPDIDLDFPRDVREILIPRVHERYGREHSALVAAFPTYRSRGAIRELGKALGLPPGEIERVARVAEPWATSVDRDIELALEAAGEKPGAVAAGASPPVGSPAWSPVERFGGEDPGLAPWRALEAVATSGNSGVAHAGLSAIALEAAADRTPGQALDAMARAYADFAEPGGDYWVTPDGERGRARGTLEGRWGWLARLSREAYGLPRHLSQHPGGMIVSTRPLVDCVPLVPAAMAGRQMCQWDKDSCADAGFLKIDLLGLGMLSAVERCVEEIARTRGERIDLSRIPFDDGPTYEAVQAADTMGVFQIESRAQMQSLLRTKPETLEDLTIQVAIVRPGPIVGGAVNPYIERKQKLREDPGFQVPYPHPSLEPVLRETLGTIIFQDQVLEVAMAFAGFSPGEAEGLRRAMSRKRSAAAIEAYHRRFVEGAARTHGASPEVAEEIFAMIAGFSGFGFPKAHGAAFGLLAYQSTWLRVHYKPEFTCALLNEQPMGFYPSDTLVHEAQRTGMDVLAPDVNASRVQCHVEAPARIRIGLGYLVGARADDMAAVVAEREAGGPYRDLGDLASRAGVGRPALEVLAWSGACDSLIGGSSAHARRAALWRVGVAAPARGAGQDARQLALPLELPGAPALRPLEAWEAMVADYATTGLTAGAHPVALLRGGLPAGAASSEDLRRLPHGTPITVAGLVVARQRPATANGIVFLLLEDELGTINLIVPPPVYDRDRLVVRGEPLVVATGRLEKHPRAEGAINVVVSSMRPIEARGNGRDDLPEPAELPAEELAGTAGAAEAQPVTTGFQAVAPPIQNFAAGRSR